MNLEFKNEEEKLKYLFDGINNYQAIIDQQNKDKVNNNSILSRWKEFRITAESNYPTPEPIISINGQSIATAGNIIAVSGLQKSGKSSFSNIVLSGCIKEQFETMDGVPPVISIKSSGGKAIIHIDTEQAKHRHLANLKGGILKRIGRTTAPENLLSFNVRGLDIEKCIELLNDVFTYANQTFGGVHLCLIDGFADLIKSVNDEESSNNLVKYLDGLATEYNTLIIGIIHRNPNDSKVRGHLGSQLLRKCEAVLAIKKDGDLSYIDPEELRTASKNDIPKLMFQYDKDKGYHVCVGEHTESEQPNKLEFLENLLELSFEVNNEMKYKELIAKMVKITGKGVTTCKGYLNEMESYEMVFKENRGIWKRSETLETA
jgi:hypothetical protein